MKSELIEAKEFHTGRITRSLRVVHRDLLLRMHVDVHRDLRETFDQSMWSKAWLLDDRLMAIGGVTGSVMSTEGMVWLALSEDALPHSYRIAREAMRQLDRIMLVRRKLSTLVLKEDRPAIRFAHFMGFQDGRPATINGAKALVMTYGRSWKEVA